MTQALATEHGKDTTPAKPRALNGVAHWMRGADLPRLTRQQMALVKALASGKHTQTSAYEEAYPTSKTWPRKDVWAAASRAANHPKVKAWLDFAWQAEARHVNRSALGHLHRLEALQQKALDRLDEAQLGDDVPYMKVILEAEKQHAQALGIGQQEQRTANVTVNLVSFADQEVMVSEDGRNITARSLPEGDTARAVNAKPLK